MKKTDTQQRREAITDLQRAEQAQQLINNPLYLEALTAMKAALYGEFEDSKFTESDKRHELWQRMQLLKQFQGKFESIIKQGDKARTTLSLLDKAKEKVKNLSR